MSIAAACFFVVIRGRSLYNVIGTWTGWGCRRILYRNRRSWIVNTQKIKESWLSHLSIIRHCIVLSGSSIVVITFYTSFLHEYATQNPIPYLVCIVLPTQKHLTNKYCLHVYNIVVYLNIQYCFSFFIKSYKFNLQSKVKN